MIPTANSIPKTSSTPVFSLPPPCSYEDLYSSYQKEWERQKQTNGTRDALRNEDIANDLDIDASVSDLKWINLSGSNGDISESDSYLLACTGSGEILAWKLTQSTGIDANGNERSDASSDTGRAVLLKQHARCNICRETGEGDDVGCDENDDRDLNALHGMCLVKVATANGEGDVPTKSSQRGRKRQRPKNEKETSNGGKTQEQILLIVAGEGGLWSIPLLDVLQQPWENNSSQETPSSLLSLSNRPIQKLQTSQSTLESEEIPQQLFALERDTNTLAIWNLSTLLERSANGNSDKVSSVPDEKIDLSRIFSGDSTSTSKPKKRRKIDTRVGRTECATTISIVPTDTNTDNGNSGLSLLVGTDKARLWVVPIPGDGSHSHGSKSCFFSLQEEKEPPTKPSYSRGGNSRAASIVWKVTDILATKGGTWWTAAAVAPTAGKENNTGLLVTWHASTGMVVARQETREAIVAILEHHQLYSAANEGAVTVWDSSFGLKRSGRFWVSPPSSKALAILSESESGERTIMAVAGVGKRVDLFVDHCRVQTVRI